MPDQPSQVGHSTSRDIDPRGRATECPSCERRLIVRGGQTWASRSVDASVLVIAADKDGAIVEQIGREQDRWGIRYADLLRCYRLVAQIQKDGPA